MGLRSGRQGGRKKKAAGKTRRLGVANGASCARLRVAATVVEHIDVAAPQHGVRNCSSPGEREFAMDQLVEDAEGDAPVATQPSQSFMVLTIVTRQGRNQARRAERCVPLIMLDAARCGEVEKPGHSWSARPAP